MPSPVGHALGGIAAAWVAVPSEARRHRAVGSALVVAALAVAPDLDLLIHDHRGFAHSLGMAVVAGLIAWGLTRQPRWGLAATAAIASHVFLDWLGTDTRPPIGVMAFWPVSRQYFESALHLFPAVSRRYWLAEFWVYNFKALAVEVCLLGPVTWVVLARVGRGERQR
jgi:membrane-bound metal-dependent hydrolase YbcI (DUF457 family)